MTTASVVLPELQPQPQTRFEMSPSIGTLVGALAKARKTFKPIIKEAINPFFKSKYADLSAVIEATKDGLSDNGLAVIQPPAFDRATGTVEILTLLAHASGEWIKTTLDMPISKSDAQGVGSAITYGRRYAYSAVLNVASESDDDASAAAAKPKSKAAEESDVEFDQRTGEQTCLAVFQIQAIDEAIKRSGKTEEEVLAYLGLIGHKRIEHLLKSEFQDFLKWANSTPKPPAKQPPQLDGTVWTPPAKQDPIRAAANKRLWALASKHLIPEGDLKQCAYERYKVHSMSKLATKQLQEMAVWVQEVASAVQES